MTNAPLRFRLVLEKDVEVPGKGKRKSLGPFQWVRVEYEFAYGDDMPVLSWSHDKQVWIDNDGWSWSAFQITTAD